MPQEKIQRNFGGEIIPTIGAIGGGILGAGAGPIGAIAGSAAGGLLGESIQQRLEIARGIRQKINPGQAIGTGIISGVTEGAGQAIGAGFRLAKPQIIKLFSKMSGYDDSVIQKALERTPGVIEGFKKGGVAVSDLAKRIALGVQKKANEFLSISQKKISELNKKSFGGPGFRDIAKTAIDDSKNFIKNIVNTLRTKHNIGIDNKGILSFTRTDQPSKIVSGGDKATLQEGFNTLRSILNNLKIKHIDSVFERLLVLQKKTPVGSPTGAETKAILGDIIENLHSFLDNLPTKKYGTAYKEYVNLLKENLPQRVMIRDAKEIFGYGTLSVKDATIQTKKILALYNSGMIDTAKLAETVGGELGEDILGTSAGAIIKTGREVYKGGGITTSARGTLVKLIQGIPRQVIENVIETGDMTNPIIQNIARKTGLTGKALLIEMENLIANKTRQ